MHIGHSARLSYHYVTEKDVEFLWELDQDEAVMFGHEGLSKRRQQG